MAKDNLGFMELIEKITHQEVPSLKEAGYQVAKERSIANIGAQLKAVYEKVLAE